MSFTETFVQMLVILFAISCGYAAHYLGLLGGELDQRLCRLLLSLVLPSMIIASVITGDDLPGLAELLSILGVAAIFYGMAFLLAFLLPRFLGGTPGQQGVWRYALAFPNIAFIGYPVVVKLFGPAALFYAVVMTMPFNLMSFSFGPLMLTGTRRFSLKKMLSPCVVASIIALALALARIRPPALVGECLDFIGDIGIPFSLMVVGSLLADLPLKQILGTPRIWCLTCLRLLVMPAMLALILRPLNLEPILSGVAIMQMGMPIAATGSMLCMENGGDTACMAQSILVTTAASIFTIPLIAALLL